MKYRVHRFDINMTKDQNKLEKFLNELEGEVVSIFPNIRPKFLPMGATASLYPNCLHFFMATSCTLGTLCAN